jgi:hypothetical protein
MVRRMLYFRLKWRRLPAAYRAFLADVLPPGGTVVVAECRKTWATTRVGERHVFQHGAVGGATEEEYLEGSPRVAELLARVGARKERWPSPPADGRSPEAEWGFEPALLDDIADFARARGLRVVRLAFDDPAQLSPPVADLYRGWNARRGIAESRLLVESFILLEPHWCLRLGAVPFWMTFNMEPSAAWLERYLDERPPFDEIHLTLFAHGADSVGLPPIERWRGLAARAVLEHQLVGVDEEAYPAHFAVFARYSSALRHLPRHHPLPPPLPFDPALVSIADSPWVSVEPLG